MSRHVPYLADEAIERDAAALLAEFAHARGIVLAPPIPIEDILEKHLGLRIEFDDLHDRLNLPRRENGRTDILGAIYGDGSIFIDETLDPEEHPDCDGRYRFTVVHELGHFQYHRHLICDEGLVVEENFESGQLSLRGEIDNEDLRRAEWQANRFASCLLVPLPLLALEWFNWMKSLRPFVFKDFARDPRWWQPSERRQAEMFREIGARPNHEVHDYAFNKVASQIAPIFNVSKQMMRIRLEEVGLLRVCNEIASPDAKFNALDVGNYERAARDRVSLHGRIFLH